MASYTTIEDWKDVEDGYDNAHERSKGHERHTRDGVEAIEFPGMLPLYDRFKRETEEMSPVSWNWPE